MPILVKVLMIGVGVYLMGVYIFRFVTALIGGALDEDDETVSYMWPLALWFYLLEGLLFIGIGRVWPKISRPFKISMHYLGICLYWIFLPFRPAAFGKCLHRLLRKGNNQ